MKKFGLFNATALTLGFAFLYVPIILLIIFSFNESRLVTVWGGFSTKWYAEVFSNEGFMDAAWVTFRVALLSASIATILWHHGGHRCSSGRGASPARRCSPAWSMRRLSCPR